MRNSCATSSARRALACGAHLHRHPPLDAPAKGGHFAALEQPELLAADIIAFFAGLG
jgi:hypothetical protein